MLRLLMISLLLVVLTLTFVVFQFIVVFNMTFLQPEFYDDIFKQHGFYAQLRQLAFRMAMKNLPNAQDGLPYLEKALTENWLRDEIFIFSKEIMCFLKGKKDELPVIPFYRLKKRLQMVVDEGRTEREKEQVVTFWFPLPDNIRLQDFSSIDFLWKLRWIVEMLGRSMWICATVVVVVMGLLIIITSSWRYALIWVGAAMIAAGVLNIGIGLAGGWIVTKSNLLTELIVLMSGYGIPVQSIEGLFWGFVKSFASRVNALALSLAAAGGLIILFIPLKEKN